MQDLIGKSTEPCHRDIIISIINRPILSKHKSKKTFRLDVTHRLKMPLNYPTFIVYNETKYLTNDYTFILNNIILK